MNRRSHHGFPPQLHPAALLSRRHPFLRRLQHLFRLAGALAASWFILASVGILPFPVTHARHLESPPQRVPSSRQTALLQPGDPLAKIFIPRIGFSAVVAEDGDESTLLHALGRTGGSAAPWDSGHVALAARGDIFVRNLSHVQLDDLIQLQTSRAAYRYRVTRITMVDPHVELPLSSEWDLTLVASPFHSIGPAPQRCIVQASRLPVR